MQIRSYFILSGTLSILALTGCSSGGSGGSQPAPPQSKEEALERLTPNQKQNFENWKNQIIKSCDAAQAFGLQQHGQTETNGIDGAALIRRNGNSAVFSDGQSVSILTGYSSFPGTSTTKSEESVQENGQGYSITAETKREGSTCTVSLFGKEVFKTSVVQNFNIGFESSAQNLAQVTGGIPQVRPLGTSGESELTGSSIYSLLSQSFQPTKASIAVVAAKIGLSADEATRYLRVKNDGYETAAVRIANEPSAVWSNNQSGNLIAAGTALKKYFGISNQNVRLDARIPAPRFNFGDTQNTGDQGNLSFAATANVSRSGNETAYALQKIEFSGISPFDKDEALSCAKSRAQAYAGSSLLNEVKPSVSLMLSPCFAFYSGIENLSFESGLMKSLLPQIFSGVNPSGLYNYGGWNVVLSTLALQAMNDQKDIRAELDPKGRTKIVSVVADILTTLYRELQSTKNLLQNKNDVFQMGMGWAFRGQMVSSARIAHILNAVDNSVATFPVSSGRLLSDLSSQPNSSDSQLDFALSLDDSYKREAMAAFSLSKDLNYGGFETNVFNRVIQQQTSVADLKNWSIKFTGIKTEINKYPAISSFKSILVGLSVKWLNSGEATQHDLGPVYAGVNNAADTFDQSTKSLVQDLGSSLVNNQDALSFARSISPEYKQLALAILANAAASDYQSWGDTFFNTVLQKRPTVEQLRIWNDTWTAAIAFTKREHSRTQGEFGSTNEWNRKKVVDMAVRESWTSAEFSALETIAPLARSKNTCDHYAGLSSLADCAGLSLFSKQKSMLFDPTFAGRYSLLGQDFILYMAQLGNFEQTTLRWDLVGAFFNFSNPVWSNCDQATFNQKAAALKLEVGALARESDQLKKWEIERQIKDSISNCR